MFQFLNKMRAKRAERQWFAQHERGEIFQWIFDTNKWGSAETPSGKGSETQRTEAIREELPRIVEELNIKSILDLPCGDLHWIASLNLPVHYIGADIVPTLIEQNRTRYPELTFEVIDACVDPLPDVDLILMRDLLVHLSFADGALVVDNLRKSKARYIACTTFPKVEQNRDQLTGKHRQLNMRHAPFGWGEPVLMIDEKDPRCKALGVWELEQLRAAQP